MPRPAASALINIFQPLPACATPPMMLSSGMKTSRPTVGPFWNTIIVGRCRRPISTPGKFVGTSATVMPISSRPPIRWSGSWSLKASPITVATGAKVRSEEHTSELQSRPHLVCRLLLEKKKKKEYKQKKKKKKKKKQKK